MPYRHAHWYLLSLVPVIVLAFWPGYFGQLPTAPLALHGHGISATLWLMLLALQLWSIHARRPALHRSAGLTLFVIVPVFAGASLAALQGGVALYAVRSDPFHATFGVRLALVDLVALACFIWLVWQALVQRRRARLHAAAMLATAVLVLPPILGRLVPLAPGFADWNVAGRTGFALAFYIGEALATVGAFVLYLADRGARPFLIVTVAGLAQCLVFETAAAGEVWTQLALASLAIPMPLLFLVGMTVTAAILAHGWSQVPPRERARSRSALQTS